MAINDDNIVQDVFDILNGVLDDLAPADPYPAVFDHHIHAPLAVAEAAAAFLPVDVPLGVGREVELPAPAAEVIAASCTSLWMGADLMDDVADEDLEGPWPRSRRPCCSSWPPTTWPRSRTCC